MANHLIDAYGQNAPLVKQFQEMDKTLLNEKAINGKGQKLIDDYYKDSKVAKKDRMNVGQLINADAESKDWTYSQLSESKSGAASDKKNMTGGMSGFDDDDKKNLKIIAENTGKGNGLNWLTEN